MDLSNALTFLETLYDKSSSPNIHNLFVSLFTPTTVMETLGTSLRRRGRVGAPSTVGRIFAPPQPPPPHPCENFAPHPHPPPSSGTCTDEGIPQDSIKGAFRDIVTSRVSASRFNNRDIDVNTLREIMSLTQRCVICRRETIESFVNSR